MASLAAARCMSVRLVARQLTQDAGARGFRTSAASLAAQNFTMPALSPTMTEGNIAKWNVKEGDSFAAGDVLLEIETDKASMDVEAQDDGILAKITQGDGSKGIKVGTRIGVIAEPGDDLSSLEIPEEDKSAAAPPKKEAPKEDSKETSKSQAETSSSSSSEEASGTPEEKSAKKSPGPAKKQTYPLLPSVEHLIHEHGLDSAAIDKMTPSGPNNRLLKGDVLAYLGSIPASYPTELSNKIAKLSHLDLSDIKLAAPREKAASESVKATEAAPEPPVIEEAEVAIPISMKAVLEVQKRIQSTLGVFIPLSTFIARATDLANEDLPRSKSYKPTADELFNQVLGLDTISSAEGVRGNLLPQIAALPPSLSFSSLSTSSSLSSAPSSPSPRTNPRTAIKKDIDIIDLLSGRSPPSTTSRALSSLTSRPRPGLSNSLNLFSVVVTKGDEKRAQVFLDRVKSVLESEPGRLVL